LLHGFRLLVSLEFASMSHCSFRTLLLAGVAAISLGGLTQPASATVTGPPASDFQVIESCVVSNGCSGTFDVINNTGTTDGSWYVWGFVVNNPFVRGAGTTQTDWTASTCTNGSSCTGGEDNFQYSNTNGASSDFANDVGPGQSSDLFTFNSQEPASPVTLDVTDGNGHNTTVNLSTSDQSVPEPVSLALFGTGLLGLAGVVRRRRS
jgi:PEP-CTERM motif